MNRFYLPRKASGAPLTPTKILAVFSIPSVMWNISVGVKAACILPSEISGPVLELLAVVMVTVLQHTRALYLILLRPSIHEGCCQHLEGGLSLFMPQSEPFQAAQRSAWLTHLKFSGIRG